MKLETVKDLEKSIDREFQKTLFCNDGKEYGGAIKFVFIGELKQKAIKWLLHSLKKKKNPYKSFMDFHNITHEDLK